MTRLYSRGGRQQGHRPREDVSADPMLLHALMDLGTGAGPRDGAGFLTVLLSEGVLRSGGTRRVGGGDGAPTACSNPKALRPWPGKRLRIVPWRSG